MRGVIEVARALIDVLDDLERAIEHAKANHPADDPLLLGTELVYRNAMARLKQFGIEPVEAEGEKFDPQTQEALVHQPTDQAEPMTVLKVIQKGYVHNGRTIRPAKVIVAAPVQASTGQSQEQAEAELDEPTE